MTCIIQYPPVQRRVGVVRTFTIPTRLSTLPIPTIRRAHRRVVVVKRPARSCPPKNFSRAACGPAVFFFFFSPAYAYFFALFSLPISPALHLTLPTRLSFSAANPARFRAQAGPRMLNLTGKGQVGGATSASHPAPHPVAKIPKYSVRGAVRTATPGGPQGCSPALPPSSEHPLHSLGGPKST